MNQNFWKDFFTSKFKTMSTKQKKLIERNLKFSDKYVYEGLAKGSIIDAQFTMCDNCGKLITNMVNIYSNSTGKKYTIGTDCAKTLQKSNCLLNRGYDYNFSIDIMNLAEAERFATEVKKGKIYTESAIYFHIKNDKGKEICTFNSNFKTFYPELMQNI